MKKQDLLSYFDNELLEKLYVFCYARTNDSYEAEELCSDIVYAIVKAARTGGNIDNALAFIWKIARNVYADFSAARRKQVENFYEGDPEEVLLKFAEEDTSDGTSEQLNFIYRRIAFLTKAYREVMIMFYMDGFSTKEIAIKQGVSENAVRQRLFSAREQIKSEVKEMAEVYNKPVSLDKIDFVLWGTGLPSWGDPRSVFTRMFSKHIVWLCSKKQMSASEISEELNVPTVYVEEELEILRAGANGEYGLLRRLENGKYALNFVLFGNELMEKANAIYSERLPMLCKVMSDYIEAHKEEYLAFPYLNKKVDLNLILWQQISAIVYNFEEQVERELKEKYFAGVKTPNRPFSIFGYVDNGKRYGSGWDGINAQNVCGYSNILFDNIYITRIARHFSCGHNVSTDPLLQLTLRSIEGLDIETLSEREKEQAARAIECGYIYREGNMLYTKILVSNMSDRDRLFDISDGLKDGYFDADAAAVAKEIAELIKNNIPDYLIGEWEFANRLAGMPILDAVVESLIEKGDLVPPENGVGAEGCWVSVEK